MTHPQLSQQEQCSSFTITQVALGSPLQFEPALGSQELDNLIDVFVSGSAMPQQKRAKVVLEFLNSIDAMSYSHPVSIRYHVPQILIPNGMPRHSSLSSLNISVSGISYDHSAVKEETLRASKSTASMKRAREEVASPNAPNAKRLPGFSIMTRDGVDITDLASRGPKTKEQRDHAALMRKLKACAVCKKSKQRCDPSHHRRAPSSATSSTRSASISGVSSTGGSRGSISPRSSLGESFGQSPTQNFVNSVIAQTGQCFPAFPSVNPSHLPMDFPLPDTLLTDSGLPALDFDAELFQLADMEFDSWNTDFTVFPPASNLTSWNSHEDVFASNANYATYGLDQTVDSMSQARPDSLSRVTNIADQVLPRQDATRLVLQPGQLVSDAVHLGSSVAELDIDQLLQSATGLESCQGSQSQLATSSVDSGHTEDKLKRSPLKRDLHNPTLSRDHDYILYPDSPQFDLGLEPHLVSHDIADKEWLSRRGAGSKSSKKDYEDASPRGQESQEYTSARVGASGLSCRLPSAQTTELLDFGAPYQYLPSPPPSGGSEDGNAIGISDGGLSEVDDSAYDAQVSSSQSSAVSGYTPSQRRPFGSSGMNLVQQQRDPSFSGSDDVNGQDSLVRGTSLSPGQPPSLRSVITADVNVGYQSQPAPCNHTQFARTQGSLSDIPLPDVRNHSINFLDDQQAQQILINRDPVTLHVDQQGWDHMWKESDLRQAGLVLRVSGGGSHGSRLRNSSHDMSQEQLTVDDVSSNVTAGPEQRSTRIMISSDIPGEDERKYLSILKRTQQRMITIMTLCTLMTLSVMWTITLLTAPDSISAGTRKQGTEAIMYGSWIETGCLPEDSQNSVRSISFEPQDPGFPWQPNSAGPGPDPPTLTTSSLDFCDPGPYDIRDSESATVPVDSRPDSETLSVFADDSSITSESWPGSWTHQPSPTPSPPSTNPASLSGTGSPAAFTMIPASSAKVAPTTLVTLLPARSSLPSQPKEAYLVVTTLPSPSQSLSTRQGSVSKALRELQKPSRSSRFNFGHLAMRITSLRIL